MTFKASCRVHTVTPHSVLNRKQGVSQCPVFLFLAFDPPPALRRRSTLKSKDGRQCTEHLRRHRRCLQSAACLPPHHPPTFNQICFGCCSRPCFPQQR